MKVETNYKTPEFNPVEVKLTFETAEELELFKQLMWTNSSVPVAVYPKTQTCAVKLYNLMSAIGAKVRLL